MKRAMFSALAVVVLAALCGCRVCQQGHRSHACSGDSCAQTAENCQSCDNGSDPNCNDPARRPFCRLCRGRGCERCCEQACDAPGPATGAVTYPYYTVRGPRDFLAKNPSSIGP
jgi:hypothetical protein